MDSKEVASDDEKRKILGVNGQEEEGFFGGKNESTFGYKKIGTGAFYHHQKKMKRMERILRRESGEESFPWGKGCQNAPRGDYS